MKPLVSVITPGVDDLQRVLRFYRDGLGLATDGADEGLAHFYYRCRNGSGGGCRPGLIFLCQRLQQPC